MADKTAQIEALLTDQMQRLIQAEGLDPKKGSSYARVFDVSRAEIDAHVAARGLPAEVKICTEDSRRDGLYLVRVKDQWQLYTQERGCRGDEETFTDEHDAQIGLTSLLLSYCGPCFVHLLGIEEAILRFSDWPQPWRFHPWVEAQLPTVADRTVFGFLWSEASAARHWKDADLEQAARAVELVLRKRHPTLHQGTVAAVVRAAAYRWR